MCVCEGGGLLGIDSLEGECPLGGNQNVDGVSQNLQGAGGFDKFGTLLPYLATHFMNETSCNFEPNLCIKFALDYQ